MLCFHTALVGCVTAVGLLPHQVFSLLTFPAPYKDNVWDVGEMVWRAAPELLPADADSQCG